MSGIKLYLYDKAAIPGQERNPVFSVEADKFSQDAEKTWRFTQAKAIAHAILDVKDRLRLCSLCQNVSEAEVCEICLDPKRDQSKILVVKEPSTPVARNGRHGCATWPRRTHPESSRASTKAPATLTARIATGICPGCGGMASPTR